MYSWLQSTFSITQTCYRYILSSRLSLSFSSGVWDWSRHFFMIQIYVSGVIAGSSNFEVFGLIAKVAMQPRDGGVVQYGREYAELFRLCRFCTDRGDDVSVKLIFWTTSWGNLNTLRYRSDWCLGNSYEYLQTWARSTWLNETRIADRICFHRYHVPSIRNEMHKA